MSTTYKDAGVDIEAGEETVRRIASAVKETHTPNVLNDIGAFGGLFAANFQDMKEPVLVSSVDGVGTKLKVASMYNKHDTVGQDLVNHCVDDILTTGARPLFFLDYFATGKLNPVVAEQVILGFTKACKENGCALLGGETAEMPGMYAPNEYDIAGTIVGIVDKANILDKSNVQKGDVLVALPSVGLHTNGFSLARSVLFKHFDVTSEIDELGMPLGDALLAVHKSYYPTVYPLLQGYGIHAVSHITGGGIIGNTTRVIPKDFTLNIDWNAWEPPALFQLIQKLGEVPESDMRRTFNLGVGLILITANDQVDILTAKLKEAGETPFIMGQIA